MRGPTRSRYGQCALRAAGVRLSRRASGRNPVGWPVQRTRVSWSRLRPHALLCATHQGEVGVPGRSLIPPVNMLLAWSGLVGGVQGSLPLVGTQWWVVWRAAAAWRSRTGWREVVFGIARRTAMPRIALTGLHRTCCKRVTSAKSSGPDRPFASHGWGAFHAAERDAPSPSGRIWHEPLPSASLLCKK